MNRAARRLQASRKRKQVLCIALPTGETVTGRAEEVALRLKMHLERTDPDAAMRLATRAAAAEWARKQRIAAAHKQKQQRPPPPVVLTPQCPTFEVARAAFDEAMRQPLFKEIWP